MKSTTFLIDYAMGIYETQGNFKSISKTKVYPTLYKRLNKSKTSKDKKISVVDYLYTLIGYPETKYLNPAIHFDLYSHAIRYNSLQNIKTDTYLNKRLNNILSLNNIDLATALDGTNLLGFINTEPTELQSSNINNKVYELMFNFFKSVINAYPDALTAVNNYYSKFRVFEGMKDKDPNLFNFLIRIIPPYGGELKNKSNADVYLFKGRLFTDTKLTISREDILINILYMATNTPPGEVLEPRDKFLLERYKELHGNFRYMYIKSPTLYKKLMNYSTRLGISFKELLEKEGYTYISLKYTTVDYTFKNDKIEARVANIDTRDTITMDRVMYAWLYDNDLLNSLSIKEFKLKDEFGVDISSKNAVLATDNKLDGRLVAGVYLTKSYVAYIDGHTLNISTDNILPA